MAPPPAEALSRDRFVTNVLWVGVCFACQGQLGDHLAFSGNHRRGEASGSNGGDSFDLVWGEEGVVVHVYELGELPVAASPLPSALGRLAQQLPASGVRRRPTRTLWISGDAASPRLPPWPPNEILGLLDAFSGPSLVDDDEVYALERALLEAIVGGREQLTDALVAALMEGPVEELAERGLDGVRVLAEDLARFGLRWPNLEGDLSD